MAKLTKDATGQRKRHSGTKLDACESWGAAPSIVLDLGYSTVDMSERANNPGTVYS